MSMDHRHLIEKNRVKLIKAIDITNCHLWDHLRELGVVTETAASKIRSDYPYPGDQISALLDYIQKRPLSCYRLFRRALNESNQGHVLKEILPPYEYEKETSCQTELTHVDVVRLQLDNNLMKQKLQKEKESRKELKDHRKQNVALRQENLSLKGCLKQSDKELNDVKQQLQQSQADILKATLAKLDIGPLFLKQSEADLDLSALNQQYPGIYFVHSLGSEGLMIAYLTECDGGMLHEMRRLSPDGQVGGPPFSAQSYIRSVLTTEDGLQLLVVEAGGRIALCELSDLTRCVRSWKLDVLYDGSPCSGLGGAAALSDHQLLLTDRSSGLVFLYNLQSKKKAVKKKGLNTPYCISSMSDDNGNVTFFITEWGKDQICVFDSSFGLKLTVGGYGTTENQLQLPRETVVTPGGSLLVTDWGNHRVTEFTRYGTFIRHWLKWESNDNEFCHPASIAFVHPHLWVVTCTDDQQWELARYRIFLDL